MCVTHIVCVYTYVTYYVTRIYDELANKHIYL